MAEQSVDVKTDQPSSSGSDVKEAASSPALSPEDITASPSAEDSTSVPAEDKPHEQAVPYERFSEKVEEANRLKAELEALKSSPPPVEKEFDWGFDTTDQTKPADQPNAPAPFATEDIESKLSEDLATKPLQTLWPMMLEAARQDRIAARKLESQVRSMPDFNEYEQSYYSVPENVVQQTKQNDELVKYLLAKHRASLQGKPVSRAPTSQPNPATEPSPPPTNGPPPTNVEELAEKYRKEGEARALERINQQRGVTSESTATYQDTVTDEPEFDEAGNEMMRNLGLTPEQTKAAAKNLDSWLRGK